MLSIPGAHDRLCGMRRWIVVAAVAAGIVLAGCETAPEEQPAPVVTLDTGWQMRTVDTSFSVDWEEPFVKLVDLARLRVGMSKQEVLAIFPDPDETTLRANDELWDYGFAELIFRGNFLRDWFNR